MMQDEPESFQEPLAAITDLQAQINALNAMAWSIRDRDKAQSEELASRAYALSSQADTTYVRGMIEALRTVGNLHMLAGNDTRSLLESERAFALLQSSPDPVLEVHIRRNFVWSYAHQGELERAMQHALTGMSIARDLGIDVLEAMMFDAFGVIYTEAEEHEQAVANDMEALRLYRQARDIAGEATMLNNTAYSMLLAGTCVPALENVTRSLKLSRDNGFQGIYATALGTAGEIYLLMEEYGSAVELFSEYLELAENLNLEVDCVAALGLLGRVYYSQGDNQQARSYFELALKRATLADFASEEYKYHALLADLLEQEGNYQAALEHYKHFHTLKERIFSSSVRNIASLQVLGSLATANADIERYHRETEALQQEIEQRKRAQETLHALATQDPLTGVLNRRQFKILAEEQLANGHPMHAMALVLFDLDHFKTVNDTFGHNIGDQVLQKVAQTVLERLRPGDLLARLGGDEFIILLLNAPPSEAAQFGDKVRSVIQAQPVVTPRAPIAVTVSVGIACAVPGDSLSLYNLVQEADQALYHAKRGGRNQTILWDPALGVVEHEGVDRMPDLLPTTLDL